MPVNPFDEIAEKCIREAMQRGDFDDLEGSGRPLPPDDGRMVPPELRMAYRILRNANCLPPELAKRREIRELEDLLAHVGDDADEQARDAHRRLAVLRLAVERHGRNTPLWADPAYYDRLAERLGRRG